MDKNKTHLIVGMGLIAVGIYHAFAGFFSVKSNFDTPSLLVIVFGALLILLRNTSWDLVLNRFSSVKLGDLELELRQLEATVQQPEILPAKKFDEINSRVYAIVGEFSNIGRQTFQFHEEFKYAVEKMRIEKLIDFQEAISLVRFDLIGRKILLDQAEVSNEMIDRYIHIGEELLARLMSKGKKQ